MVTGAMSMTDYISTILKMYHKLLYEKFGVLDWCRCHMKKNSPNNKIID